MPSRALTVKEQALWMLQRLAPEAGVANETIVFRVRGSLDHDLLADQVRQLAARHPALRTVFPEEHGEPVARVLSPDDAPVPVSVFDESAEDLAAAVADFAEPAFDILREPPIRVGIWHRADGDVCCVAVHHLVYDAWTAGTVFRELVAGYNAAAGYGTPVAFAEHAPVLTEPPLEPASLEYWRDHTTGARPAAQRLALGRPDPDVPTFAGTAMDHVLPTDVCTAVADLARRHRATENIVMLAAYYLLLARHGAGPDLVVGVSADVREADQRAAIGYHVNTLPLCLRVDLDETFGQLVRRTRDVFLSGLSHRHVPYEAVLPGLQAAGTDWRSPLFRHMFNYRPVPLPSRPAIGGLDVELVPVPPRYSRHDLEFIVETSPAGRSIHAVYSTETLDAEDVRALLLRYEALLTALASEERPLRDVPWWSTADQAAVATANDTADPEEAPTVLSAFLSRAAEAPEAVAVVDEGPSTTYGELSARAAAIAERLRGSGVRRGDVVALYARRGAELAAAALGVWLAGASYLPLHPAHPADLLTYQLGDSGAAAVLADRALPEGTTANCPVLPITVSAEQARDAALPADTRVTDSTVVATDRAYLIYTSGSTGRPKGVGITHQNLANVVHHFLDALRASRDDATLWLTTFAFDISALELFLPLSVGGRSVVAPDEAQADPTAVIELIERHNIRIIQATPTTLALVPPVAGSALTGRTVLCGGEPLSGPLARGLLATGCQLFNVYGPTETTIWSTVGEIRADRAVTIGTPLRNTVVFVAGADGSPLPPGLNGELCIAGEGVAQGYVNRPELTAVRFAQAPGIGRHYRTGDRARWRHDGTLELHGRTDRQVKIRSHRLELGEVEAALLEHPSVAVAAVVLRDDSDGQPGLVAFVQPPTAGADESEDALWAHLRDRLPSYAVPDTFVPGPVPTNASGKVDYPTLMKRSVSPTPREQRRSADDAVPADAVVDSITALWQDLLESPDLGPSDNFFLAGGHSMVAVRMLARLARSHGVRLALADLLEAPTPAGLAERVRGAAG